MGLVYLVEILIVLPGFFSSMYSLMSASGYGRIDAATIGFGCLAAVVVIAFFVIVIRIFLFKTDYLISKLKLENNFSEEKIDINLSYVSVLTMASVITGAIIIVDALPLFCRNVFTFLQSIRQFAFLFDNPSTYYIIENGIKLAIGYLLINNGKRIAEWVVKKQNMN